VGTNRSHSKTAEVTRAFQSHLNHKSVNAIFFLPCETSNGRGLSSECLKCHDRREYDSNPRGSEDSSPCRARQTRRKWRSAPPALSNKNCMFPFSHAGGGLTGIRTQSMLGHSTTVAWWNWTKPWKNSHQNNKPDVSHSRAPTTGTRNKHRRDQWQSHYIDL
jgi:hypothetical protein